MRYILTAEVLKIIQLALQFILHVSAIRRQILNHRLGEHVGAAHADRPAVGLKRPGEHDRIVGAEAEDIAGPGQLGDPEAQPDSWDGGTGGEKRAGMIPSSSTCL